MTQTMQHPASGYLAFFTIALFLIALALLPARANDPSRVETMMLRDH